jgi:hypothetical protein
MDYKRCNNQTQLYTRKSLHEPKADANLLRFFLLLYQVDKRIKQANKREEDLKQ